jgi:hypothetical protein
LILIFTDPRLSDHICPPNLSLGENKKIVAVEDKSKTQDPSDESSQPVTAQVALEDPYLSEDTCLSK